MKEGLTKYLLAGVLMTPGLIPNEVVMNPHSRPNVHMEIGKMPLDFYGLGDANNDGVVNTQDPIEIMSGTKNDRTDVNGDGITNSQDAVILSDYLAGGISNLPGDWNNLEKEAKISWLEKMIAIDETDTPTQGWSCNEYSYQTLLNFFGNKYADENISNISTGGVTSENNARFNIPAYEVSVTNIWGDSHAINGVLVGDNPLDFNDWYFFEPTRDERVNPGSNYMDPNSPVKIVWHGKTKNPIGGETYFGLAGAISFNLENGVAKEISYLNPLASRVNPNKVISNLSSLEKILVNEDVPIESLNFPESELTTNLDLNDTFYHQNKGEWDTAELRGEYVVRRTNTFSDRIPVDPTLTDTNYKIIRTEKVDIIQRTNVTGSNYENGTHDIVIKSDSTQQEIEYDLTTGVLEREEVPLNFKLYQNYPNPFNPGTVINYQLPVSSNVVLKIYDILGKEVKTLVDKNKSAGIYFINWNGEDNYGAKVVGGIYLYRLTAGNNVVSKKMILLR